MRTAVPVTAARLFRIRTGFLIERSHAPTWLFYREWEILQKNVTYCTNKAEAACHAVSTPASGKFLHRLRFLVCKYNGPAVEVFNILEIWRITIAGELRLRLLEL